MSTSPAPQITAEGRALTGQTCPQPDGSCACPWTCADECAMAGERQVAGTDDAPPTCEVHGAVEAAR